MYPTRKVATEILREGEENRFQCISLVPSILFFSSGLRSLLIQNQPLEVCLKLNILAIRF